MDPHGIESLNAECLLLLNFCECSVNFFDYSIHYKVQLLNVMFLLDSCALHCFAEFVS